MELTLEQFKEQSFPEVETGRVPLGNKITVQLQYIPKKHGSIYIPSETQDFNKNSTVVCKVLAMGGIAYRHRDSGEEWKEGAWCSVGDVVLMPRYGGFNRVEVPVPGTDGDTVIVTTYNDYDVVDKVIGQFGIYSKLL